MPNNNGKLNAARAQGANIGSAHPNMANRVVNTVAGAVTGAAGTLGGVMGSNPQRDSVPAAQYAKENRDFGRTYNVASAPGKVIAQAESGIARGAKAFGSKIRRAL